MNSRTKEKVDSKAAIQRSILMVIAKAIQKARRERRACGPSELREFHEARVLILTQVADLVRGTPSNWSMRMLRELQREYDLVYRGCRNPGMKVYLRFQARTVRELLGRLRVAA